MNCQGSGNPDPTNQPPTAPTVSTLSATVNAAFSATLPAFTDGDNDPLTYSATSLPAWLDFAEDTRILSGIPTQAGTFNLTYSATDSKNAKTNVTVTVVVTDGTSNPPTNQPPVAPA
ncbi:putative Ig domain-containing protein, partial [Larkinella soli]|uniref:putative Ig domain-containing protein n=1 Tax=Larkinella soli TaxID=1770527 RepID=UPI0035B615AF